jgi:hypothetical protein
VHLLSKVDKEQCNCIVIKPWNISGKREELPASVRRYDRTIEEPGTGAGLQLVQLTGEEADGVLVHLTRGKDFGEEGDDKRRGRRHNHEMEVGGARLALISPRNSEHNKAAAPAEGIPARCAPKSMNPQLSRHAHTHVEPNPPAATAQTPTQGTQHTPVNYPHKN